MESVDIRSYVVFATAAGYAIRLRRRPMPSSVAVPGAGAVPPDVSRPLTKGDTLKRRRTSGGKARVTVLQLHGHPYPSDLRRHNVEFDRSLVPRGFWECSVQLNGVHPILGGMPNCGHGWRRGDGSHRRVFPGRDSLPTTRMRHYDSIRCTRS